MGLVELVEYAGLIFIYFFKHFLDFLERKPVSSVRRGGSDVGCACCPSFESTNSFSDL